MSIDFFTVATVRFEILFVRIILAHDRRRVRQFNITAHPTAAWTAQQVVEAFPWETAPRYLLRDRDGAYGGDFRRRVTAMGIEEVITAPRSPWQSPYVERVIGSIRRECLDNVVVLHERHLRHLLIALYFRRRRSGSLPLLKLRMRSGTDALVVAAFNRIPHCVECTENASVSAVRLRK